MFFLILTGVSCLLKKELGGIQRIQGGGGGRDGSPMRWTAAIILQLCCVVGRAASPSASAPLLSAHHMVVPPPETEGGPPHVVVARTLSPNKRTMSPAALPGFGPPRTVDVRAWYGAISANSGAGVYWENEGDRGEEGAGSRETKECAQPLEKQEAPRRKPRKKVHRRRWSGGPWVMYQCAGYGSRSGAECRGNVTHGVAGHAGEHWNAFLCDVCSRGVPDAVYLRRRCMQCPREASCGAPGMIPSNLAPFPASLHSKPCTRDPSLMFLMARCFVRAGAAIKTARHCAWHKGPNESDLRHLRCRCHTHQRLVYSF